LLTDRHKGIAGTIWEIVNRLRGHAAATTPGQLNRLLTRFSNRPSREARLFRMLSGVSKADCGVSSRRCRIQTSFICYAAISRRCERAGSFGSRSSLVAIDIAAGGAASVAARDLLRATQLRGTACADRGE
jgi:hypothetical protein